MPKSLAHLQSMNKTSASFQIDRILIVGGFSLLKYPLIASEMLKIVEKRKRKYLMIMHKPHAHLQTMNKISTKLQKRLR